MAFLPNHRIFFSDLFAPLPEDSPASSPARRDRFDHIATYLDSTTGAWDLFRLSGNVLDYIKNFSPLSDGAFDLISKISGVISFSGISLSIPAIFTEANSLRKNVTRFVVSQDLPYSDGLRRQKIMQAGKGVVTGSMSLANVASQAVLLFHDLKVVDLAEYSPAVNFICEGSSLLADGSELIEEMLRIRSCSWERPPSSCEIAEREEKMWLSSMVVLKDIASVALAAIGLVGIVFGIATSSMAFTTPLVLSLTTVYLTMKIAGYFYKQVLEDRRASSGLAAV